MALLITRPHTHGDSACLHHMAGYGTRETGYPDFIRITPTDIRISKKSGFNITNLQKAENVRSSMNKDTEIGLTKADRDAFTFDLQKVFSVPYLSANEVYYCRQLSVYSPGVHSLSTQQAVMHVWNESTASHAAQGIASCLCIDKAAVGVTSL